MSKPASAPVEQFLATPATRRLDPEEAKRFKRTADVREAALGAALRRRTPLKRQSNPTVAESDTAEVVGAEALSTAVEVKAPAPPALPAPPDPYAALSLRPVTDLEADNLWDWARSDPGAVEFLGVTPRSSTDVHLWINTINQAGPRAFIHAFYVADTHMGFTVLAPVLAVERTALMHVYLRPEARGTLPQLMPWLIAQAEQVAPAGFHLAAFSTSEELRRLHRATLAPLGFRELVMFLR